MPNALERLPVRLPARGTFRHAAQRWTAWGCEVVDITFAEPWIEPTLSIPRVLPLTLTSTLALSLALASATQLEELRELGGIPPLSSEKTILSNSGDEEARRRLS